MRSLRFTCDRCGESVFGIPWDSFKKIVETAKQPCGCKMSKEDQEHNKKFIEFYEKGEKDE